MDINLILPFMVIFPMISAVIGYIIGRKNKKARDIFACAITAVEFAMAVFMCSNNIVFNLNLCCELLFKCR